MGKVKDLKKESQDKLLAFTKYWQLNLDVSLCGLTEEEWILRFSVNEKLSPNVAGVEITYPMANTYLHYAIKCGDLDLVKDLIENGAEIEMTEERGKNINTPLQTAADYGRADIANYLISQGAKTDNIKERYNSSLCTRHPCSNFMTLLWSMKQSCYDGLQVDYKATHKALFTPKAS